MRVTVDDDICAAFGVCVQTCPDVFELGEQGYAVVKVDVVPPELEELVRRAAAECPSRAIEVEE
ncbi:MAG: ferredoxin [Acidimicrobiales bacterium]|nr:ferredoxin [Acidimicrobiales bacterium]